VATPNFLIVSTQSEARTKVLGDKLERSYKVGAKALKFDDKERAWMGKLTVFIMEWNEYRTFARSVLKVSPKEDETVVAQIAGEMPTLTVAGGPGDKVPTDNTVVTEVLTVLLKKKMGAGDPPGWVASGFGRATAYRVSNPGATRSSFKQITVPLKELWGDSLPAQARSDYSAYVIDYLAYGPGSDMFPSFISGLRPDEGTNGMTSIDEALKGVGLDADSLVVYARAWTKPKAAPAPKTPPKK
jgi:hypothetical protein